MVLLVDKPLGWTSFDVVNKIRFALKKKLGLKKFKVGHAGTLDPMATGLLIICTGKYTKLLTDLTGLSKTYTGTIFLGATTASFDAETPVNQTFSTDHITPALIEEKRTQFIGKIEQMPPQFSALKVGGKPAYVYAREGTEVVIRSREIEIYDFKITRLELPELDFEVACSKGTYIRSLANDFGKALGSGGYLKALRRTKTGDFSIENAWQVEELTAAIISSP